jgi:uncharacterized membrane protein YvbJ
METKRCPYCGEEILLTAKKCKHCKEWLDPNGNEKQATNTTTSDCNQGPNIVSIKKQPSTMTTVNDSKPSSSKDNDSRKMLPILIVFAVIVVAIMVLCVRFCATSPDSGCEADAEADSTLYGVEVVEEPDEEVVESSEDYSTYDYDESPEYSGY